MLFIVGDLLAAAGASVSVIPAVNPASSRLSLKIPMLPENPGIAVGQSKACHPSFVATVLQQPPVCAEGVGVDIPAAHIELAAKEVSAEEMPRPCIAGPIAEFRLKKPVLKPAVVGKTPRVKVSGRNSAPMLAGVVAS